MVDESDESLMLRYCKGEVRAFEVLVKRHRKPVYNFIFRFVRDAAQADDVLQETFLRLIKSSAGYEQQARFTTWLYTIARNLCIDAARRGIHRQVVSLDAPFDGDGTATLGDRLAAEQAGTDREALGRELQLRVHTALAALPDEQREIFLLREVADLQFDEIARVVGCPANTVKSRMRYALEKLRVALEDYHEPSELSPPAGVRQELIK